MLYTRGSRKRLVVVSWLCLFLIVTSVLSALPATAQETPPEETSSGESTTSTEQESSSESTTSTEQESTDPSLTSDEEDPGVSVPEAPIEVTSVAIECAASGAALVGSFTVADPRDDVAAELQLVVGSSIVRFLSSPLTAAQTSYTFEFALDPVDITYGDSVVVLAREEGTETAFETSNTIAIAQAPDGGTTCAAVRVPSETTEPVPSETSQPAPSETTAPAPTANTPTETSEATPTETTTPAPTTATVVKPAATQEPSVTAPTATPKATPTTAPTAQRSQTTTTTQTTATGTGTVVNTNGASLRCRDAANTSARIITSLAAGTRVETRGAASNGWVPVKCGGQDGWVSAAYLKVTGTSTAEPGLSTAATYGVVVNTGGANLRCRTAPVSGATITLVPAGTRLQTRGAASGGWVPVTCAGRSGWVSAAYFNVGGTGGTTPPSGGGRYLTVTGTGGAGLRCRTAPVSGGIITVLGEGARVQTRGSASNGWVPVTCAARSGWVSAAYVLSDVSSGGSGELWLDLNLSTQYMRVYRGNTVVRGFYVSTGRPGFNTPTGTFYINRKLTTRTMTGVLGGEYYYVPNVPWVMYFTNRGHAIHGAYWHNNFGRVMSHGCVNLPVSTASWLYSVTPVGTRMRIHY